ncbi:hypothetical protein [Chitinophaga filiformis]|uniref:Outer membrane protein beta-barrel domain-containing protein n=1 Tax=Chitinophaga filiformis TaxID=104663 RepID=A0A1G7TS74_CHIFI|nr:hypothetical protein [Chitinophaga filiformis]SDG38193.1 hypothetical protein SAMN04488121_10467 [Chitinophaga filiformis]
MVCILLFTGVKAQTVPPSLDKRVRVPMKEVSITTLGDMITTQTGFILSFNAQKVIAQKQLQLRQPSYSMHQLLTMIREATGSDYTIYQDHVIFRRSNNKNVATRTATSSQPIKHVTEQRPTGAKWQPIGAGKQMHIPVTNAPPGTITATPEAGITTDFLPNATAATLINTIAGSNKTISNSPSYSLSIAPVRLTIPTIKPAAPMSLRPTSPAKRQKQPYIYEKPGLFKPFAQSGFAADEALYANVQAKAGVTLVYGIVSWGTNFSVSGFRYGAGISYPLNNRWLIELEATTGKLFKETTIHTVSDTGATRPVVYVNSQLQRVSLLVQRRISPHLSVHAGPVFNRLKSTYQLTTWPLSLATLRAVATTPEKDYITINPPYTLHRSPPEETADISTWIGFQIGISYRL